MAHLIYLSALLSHHMGSATDPLLRADRERIPFLLSDSFREVTRLLGEDPLGSGSGADRERDLTFHSISTSDVNQMY